VFQTKIYKGKKSSSLANGIKSENLESAGVSIETIAATRIQTAFRAYKVCQSENLKETNQVKLNYVDLSTSITGTLCVLSVLHTIYFDIIFC